MKKIVIVGTSCSGKTTLGKTLETKLNIPNIDIDDIHWLPNWECISTHQLQERMDEVTNQESWTVTGNYSKVQDIVWTKADTIIWLNYPLPIVLRQGLFRSLKRIFSKVSICNGNKETFLKTFFSKDSILWWIVISHQKNIERYKSAKINPAYNKHQFLEFHDTYQLEHWMDSLGSQV